jgi:hypothetical protein
MSIYAVNSKEPSKVWIPSLDTSGNGTTTLNQLLGGGNNGTLTNFALSGSTSNWVADTASGGVRAIAFDSANDYVQCGAITSLNGASKASYSAWIYRASAQSAGSSMCGFGANSGDPGEDGINSAFGVFWVPNQFPFNGEIRFLCQGGSNVYGQVSLTGTGWQHVVVAFDGTLTGNANRLKAWINGTSRTLSYTGTIGSALGTVGANYTLGTTDLANFYGGRIDDVRLFIGQTLDGSDATYLYNSNAGRGRVGAVTSTNNSTLLMGMPI